MSEGAKGQRDGSVFSSVIASVPYFTNYSFIVSASIGIFHRVPLL